MSTTTINHQSEIKMFKDVLYPIVEGILKYEPNSLPRLVPLGLIANPDSVRGDRDVLVVFGLLFREETVAHASIENIVLVVIEPHSFAETLGRQLRGLNYPELNPFFERLFGEYKRTGMSGATYHQRGRWTMSGIPVLEKPVVVLTIRKDEDDKWLESLRDFFFPVSELEREDQLFLWKPFQNPELRFDIIKTINAFLSLNSFLINHPVTYSDLGLPMFDDQSYVPKMAKLWRNRAVGVASYGYGITYNDDSGTFSGSIRIDCNSPFKKEDGSWNESVTVTRISLPKLSRDELNDLARRLNAFQRDALDRNTEWARLVIDLPDGEKTAVFIVKKVEEDRVVGESLYLWSSTRSNIIIGHEWYKEHVHQVAEFTIHDQLTMGRISSLLLNKLFDDNNAAMGLVRSLLELEFYDQISQRLGDFVFSEDGKIKGLRARVQVGYDQIPFIQNLEDGKLVIEGGVPHVVLLDDSLETLTEFLENESDIYREAKEIVIVPTDPYLSVTIKHVEHGAIEFYNNTNKPIHFRRLTYYRGGHDD